MGVDKNVIVVDFGVCVLYVVFVGCRLDVLSCTGVVFQAEDGIRYLVRARGIGDVYKRQEHHRPRRLVAGHPLPAPVGQFGLGHRAVSYTHLTLPTSDLV